MRYLTYRPANGFKRVMAYMIDVLPINLLLYLISMYGFGIRPVVDALATEPQQDESLLARWLITFSSFAIWVFYCAIAELSPWRGTFGKKIMGIRVRGLDRDNQGLSIRQVLIRNTTKFLSAVPCYLGFFWAFFTNGNRAWHDSLSKTAVAER